MAIKQKKATVRKKKVIKTDPKELLAKAVNQDLLIDKKVSSENKKSEEIQNKVVEQPIEKWWNNMKIEKFSTKEVNNEFFGHYEDWPKRTWIGPYSSQKELDEVIQSYIEETKKEVMDRKIENIHSIILDI